MSFVIQLLHSRAGTFIQWIVGMIVGWLTAQFVALGVEMPAESWHQLEQGLAYLGAFVVTFLVQWYQAKQAAKIQTAAGVKADSWIGEKTITAIEELVTKKTFKGLLPGNR